MSKIKRIVIDARFFSEAGPGRYVKNIVEHLEKLDRTNTYYIFLNNRGFKEYKPRFSNFKKILTNAKWYSFNEQIIFLLQILFKNPDLFYSPHFNIPILYPKKIVTAIPDIIMHTYSTERGTTLPKPYFKFKKFIYKLVLKIALGRSKTVIVPTYDVYNDITKYYPEVPKSKFVVAYEGVDPVFINNHDVKDDAILSEFRLTSGNFLLYISSMYEHKNVDRLIKAFLILVDKYKYDGKLVLVGKKDKFSERVYTYIKEHKLEDKIIMPGLKRYIGDEELVALRMNASLYVFPSLKEGFSLTPLEAQQAGLPCVISNISCHKEIYGDSVYYFDPMNENNMAEKIYQVLTDHDLRTMLASRGYENIKKYDWTNTAKATLQVFNETLNLKTA